MVPLLATASIFSAFSEALLPLVTSQSLSSPLSCSSLMHFRDAAPLAKVLLANYHTYMHIHTYVYYLSLNKKAIEIISVHEQGNVIGDYRIITRAVYSYIHTYIHTVHTYILYIHTYSTHIHSVHTYIHTVHTYKHTYIHTVHKYILYIHTNIHTYSTHIHTVHTYIHIYVPSGLLHSEPSCAHRAAAESSIETAILSHFPRSYYIHTYIHTLHGIYKK